jgi:hypothetical protein
MVLKITNVGFEGARAPGVVVGSVGVELDPNGPCPTLRALCGGACAVALFDASFRCCPLFWV